jgi:DNA-binding transcriptional MerR regulator
MRHLPAGHTVAVEARGAYPADRAAALSGVPKATIYYWARNEVLSPSVSPTRVRLWSYSDLLGLRTIAWLRATKKSLDGFEVPVLEPADVDDALDLERQLQPALAFAADPARERRPRRPARRV